MGLSQDAVDVVVGDVVLAQGDDRIFSVGGGDGAAGSLGNMESSLVTALNAGAGRSHPLWTANPTAVTAGRLSRETQKRGLHYFLFI